MSHAAAEVGTITSIGGGFACVRGLDAAMIGEAITTPSGMAMVLAIHAEEVRLAMFDVEPSLAIGDVVRRTGRLLEVSVGASARGGVVDALGRSSQGVGDRRARRVFGPAPRRVHRELRFGEPIWTGMKRIDLFARLREGERRAICGALGSGRTTLALETMLEQATSNVHCIYASIGRDDATLASMVSSFARAGMLERATIVAARATDTIAHRALVPFSACALGEELRDAGEHVLVVIDDVDRHESAWRGLIAEKNEHLAATEYASTLSALVDRACSLRHERGGGSLTTVVVLGRGPHERGDLLHELGPSLDGGTILFADPLARDAIMPSLELSWPVSRMGSPVRGWGSKIWAQACADRAIASATPVGAPVPIEVERRIAILDQPPGRRMAIEEQVVSVWAVFLGLADDVLPEQLAAFEARLLTHLRERHRPLLRQIREVGGLSDDMKTVLRGAIDELRNETPRA